MSITIAAEPSVLRLDSTGTIRIGQTRVTLDTLVSVHHQGYTPEQILQSYPSLTLPEIYSALGYYLRHQEELDSYLAKREQQARLFREANGNPTRKREIRERLMARARAKGIPIDASISGG
jgi:uncharacterized protein (DUF433 family)